MKTTYSLKEVCLTSLLVLTMGVFGSACSTSVSGDNDNTANNGVNQNNDGGELDSFGTRALAVQNHAQIIQNYEARSGLTRVQFQYLTNKYEEQFANMPGSSDVSAFSASNRNAILNVAGAFCQLIAGNNSSEADNDGTANNGDIADARAIFFEGTNYGTIVGSGQYFPDQATKEAFVKFMTDKMWGEELTPTDQRSEDISDLVGLLDQILSTRSAMGATDRTEDAIFTICVAVFVAPQAMFM